MEQFYLSHVVRRIFIVRGQRVMMDRDLAELYGVTVKRLNEQVKRNIGRFPEDFILRMTQGEMISVDASRSQIATLKRGMNRKYPPVAFTEHGAVMLASVLNSPIAVHASIQVVRAFIHLRQFLASHRDLARKVEELEMRYDGQFKAVFDAIRELMEKPPEEPVVEAPERRMGFHGD